VTSGISCARALPHAAAIDTQATTIAVRNCILVAMKFSMKVKASEIRRPSVRAG
jgi:hypothetical protein